MLEIKSLRSKKFENMRKHCISECKLCIHIYVILILSMHIYANTALSQMLKITFNGPCLSSLIKISVKISLYSKYVVTMFLTLETPSTSTGIHLVPTVF